MAESPDDAAAPREPREDSEHENEAKALLARIMGHLEASKQALFGVLAPEDAITEIEAALKLVDEEVDNETARYALRSFVEANREHVLGFLEFRGDGGDLEKARAHFERAKELAAEFQQAIPQAAEADWFQALRTGIEMGIVQSRIPTARDDEERDRLKKRQAELMAEGIRHSGPEFAAFGASLDRFNRAIAAFRNSTDALVALDLEQARFAIGEATRAMNEMEAELAEAAQADEIFDRFGEFLRAFAPLLTAQQAYVSVLHDAIVGDVRERHVALLEAADEQLVDGLERLRRAAATMERMLGQLIGVFPIAELEQRIDGLRKVFANLRHLVKEGVSPREVGRRSAPRLVAYFAIALGVILAGVRLSGIVSEIGGTELVSIVLIALVVATGSSFGWEVAIRMVGAIPWPFGRSRDEAPPGQTQST